MTRKAETRTTRAHARARAGRTRRGFAWSMIIALAVVSLSSSAWIPAIHAAFTGTTNSTASFSFASSFGGTNVVDTTTDVVDGTTTSVAALLAAKGADGKISLREAVTAANNSAASGPYTFTMIAGTFTRPSGLNISSSLTLQGASTATTIISGGGSIRPFTTSGSGTNVTLKTLTVTNGNVSGASGGAILVFAGNLTLDSVAVTNNTSGSSGVVASGGGIYFASSGALTITNSTLGSNASTGAGGAVYQDAGSLTVTNSTISNNTSGSSGFIASGGGIAASTGVSSVALTNLTVTGNTATNGGGGLWLAATTSTLTNATIVANTQTNSTGGGLYASAGTVTIRNTIIANNTGGNCSGTITTAGYNLDSANTCSFSAGTDLRNTNPNLATLTNNGGPTNTIALNAGSPAINTGTTTSAPTTDQRAGPRVGATDIGAYEYGSTPP